MDPGELRVFLEHADQAMADENIPPRTRERVLNRLIFGRAEGYRPRARIDPDLTEIMETIVKSEQFTRPHWKPVFPEPGPAE